MQTSRMTKSQGEIEKIAATGKIIAKTLAALRLAVRPGISTGDLNRLAGELLNQSGAKSSALGYHGYPGNLCTSVNEEIVHGIPGERVLVEGDIITLDLAANARGWHADSAITIPVGQISPEAARLLKVTEEALYRGIAAARAGNRLNDISRSIQRHIEAADLSIVREYSGHGVGRSMHEDPQVLNYVAPGEPNPVLKPGMVLAIEPMVVLGSEEMRVLSDEWTVVTVDGSYAAHFEHTVVITEGDARILTI